MKLKMINIGLIIVFILQFLTACQQKTNTVQGYMDADYIYVSSPYTGILKELFVQRGETIIKGQTLFNLDLQPEKAQQQAAEARVVQSQAQLNKLQIDYDYQSQLFARYQKLFNTSSISKGEFESVKNDYRNAAADLNANKASLQAAISDLEQAKWKQASKMLVSPANGYIYDTYYATGELVSSEHPVLSIVAPENLKLVFFISEPLLKKLKLKQAVKITCDGCSSAIAASISYISAKAEYTPPYIYSENNRVKFIYRVEAKADSADFFQLHPGQPVSVELSI